MFSPITLDALRTLDAIDRRKSFAAAAEELYRVPSALSYTISKLEEELGVEIFDRSRRKAELTPVGRLILEQGRDILLATEELTQLARQKAEGWEVELTLCIDSLISYEPVFELIAEFQQIQPRVKVRLLEEVLGGGWDALNSERCDLVIGAPGASPARKIETFPLGKWYLNLLWQPVTRSPVWRSPSRWNRSGSFRRWSWQTARVICRSAPRVCWMGAAESPYRACRKN